MTTAQTTIRPATLALLIALGVGLRLAPFALAAAGVPVHPDTASYPWNFSPVLPLCIFGGAMLARSGPVYALPLGIYLAGDVGVWLVSGRLDWAFYPHQPVVYLAAALVAAGGGLLRVRRSWRRVAGVGLLSAVGFFVLTNFAVWAFGDGVRYPHTVDGLIRCYVSAVPYFRNTIVSMAVYLPLLFSRVTLRETTRLTVAPGR